ncbi:hypothetical protein niasHT_027329 [Heterodera trifolii]
MVLPSIYALFSWLFTRPVIFSTSKFSFFFSPYEDYNSTTASSKYSNIVHTFNNTLVSCFLCATYGIFCVLWVGRMLKMIAMAKPKPTAVPTTVAAAKGQNGKKDQNNGNKNSGGSSNIAARMTFLQVVFISFFNGCAAGLSVYMEHFEIYPEMFVAAQFTYVLTHAAPPFIYLAYNRTIRADVCALLYRILTGKSNTPVTVTAQRHEGLNAGLIAPTHTQSVGIGRASGAVPAVSIGADHLSILNNGVPLFRRQIAGSDAVSGQWQKANTVSSTV